MPDIYQQFKCCCLSTINDWQLDGEQAIFPSRKCTYDQKITNRALTINRKRTSTKTERRVRRYATIDRHKDWYYQVTYNTCHCFALWLTHSRTHSLSLSPQLVHSLCLTYLIGRRQITQQRAAGEIAKTRDGYYRNTCNKIYKRDMRTPLIYEPKNRVHSRLLQSDAFETVRLNGLRFFWRPQQSHVDQDTRTRGLRRQTIKHKAHKGLVRLETEVWSTVVTQ